MFKNTVQILWLGVCKSDLLFRFLCVEVEQPKPVGRELFPSVSHFSKGTEGFGEVAAVCHSLYNPIRGQAAACGQCPTEAWLLLSSLALQGEGDDEVPQAQICMQVLPLCLTAL